MYAGHAHPFRGWADVHCAQGYPSDGLAAQLEHRPFVIACRDLPLQTDRESDRDRQTDRQTGRQTDRQTETDRQTDRQTDRDRHRQTDRQTDRQTEMDRLTIVDTDTPSNHFDMALIDINKLLI